MFFPLKILSKVSFRPAGGSDADMAKNDLCRSYCRHLSGILETLLPRMLSPCSQRRYVPRKRSGSVRHSFVALC